MIFDTQITLRLFSYPIVNGQTTEKLERETTVWAARKSVNRAEYYQAAQAGKRTDAIFRMHSAEYGGEQQLGMMLMLQTREMLVQGFALDAVFRHEHLTLNDHDIEAACRSMNPQANPKQTRQQFEQSGRGFALRESAERLKANQWALEHAVIKEPQYSAPQAADAATADAAAEAASDAQASAADAPAAE